MKIVCVGMNYREHVRELGHEEPVTPVFFCKPDTALLRNNDPFYIPDFSNDLHYEAELVVRINRIVKAIDRKFASRCYDEIAVGIDFTARDVQRECVARGLPWEAAKAFDKSAPLPNTFFPLSDYPGIDRIRFRLDVNGETRQAGCTADMIFDVDTLIAYISRFMTLRIGDLIFTGTPAGVGPVHPGDRLEAYLEDRKMLDFEIR